MFYEVLCCMLPPLYITYSNAFYFNIYYIFCNMFELSIKIKCFLIRYMLLSAHNRKLNFDNKRKTLNINSIYTIQIV